MQAAWSDFVAFPSLLNHLGRDLLRWREDTQARQLLSVQSFTTEADHRADEYLKQGLQSVTPGIPVISEEDDQPHKERPETYWLIDPIDGTASWRGGFTGFVTQIALMARGAPLYGIIHAPALGLTWEALLDGGARLNGSPLARLLPNERRRVVDNTPIPQGITSLLCKALPATDYLESGSLGLKSVLVADGTADLFFKRVPIRDWDIASAAVILNEVGALLRTGSGEPWPFDGPMLKSQGLIVARDQALLERCLVTLRHIEQSGAPALNIQG